MPKRRKPYPKEKINQHKKTKPDRTESNRAETRPRGLEGQPLLQNNLLVMRY